MNAAYEVYAVRYAHLARTARHNFIDGDVHDGPMPLDYFVWAIKGGGRSWVVDTGFDAAMAGERQRQLLRPVGEGLAAIGIDAACVQDVIITHMHYDHAGNHELFPAARYHVQDDEIAFCTGRAMCHGLMRAPFDARDVQAMVSRVFRDRVVFHDGDAELAPGITVHHVGGHTRGLQVVRVATRRGWVVLASDAAHFYANWQQRRPFPIIENVANYLDALRRIEALADSPRHVIPGHDPLVLSRYPRALPDVPDIVRLDLDPLSDPD
jgi:glyoxylase-like metal-dependent hydrolase (beta-lactamase superfamily II)